MTKKERLDKIQEVLEENLNLNWVDRLVYNHAHKYYHTADIWDFEDGRPTYAYLVDGKRSYLARVIIKDEKFNIALNGMKIDVSEHWKELINVKEDVDIQTL